MFLGYFAPTINAKSSKHKLDNDGVKISQQNTHRDIHNFTKSMIISDSKTAIDALHQQVLTISSRFLKPVSSSRRLLLIGNTSYTIVSVLDSGLMMST